MLIHNNQRIGWLRRSILLALRPRPTSVCQPFDTRVGRTKRQRNLQNVVGNISSYEGENLAYLARLLLSSSWSSSAFCDTEPISNRASRALT